MVIAPRAIPARRLIPRHLTTIKVRSHGAFQRDRGLNRSADAILLAANRRVPITRMRRAAAYPFAKSEEPALHLGYDIRMANRFTPNQATSAFTLGNIRGSTETLKLRCDRCGRRGQYRINTLITRYGADRKLPDLLNDIAQCPKLHALGNDGCGVLYAETPWQAPRPRSGEIPEQREAGVPTRAYDRGWENH